MRTASGDGRAVPVAGNSVAMGSIMGVAVPVGSAPRALAHPANINDIRRSSNTPLPARNVRFSLLTFCLAVGHYSPTPVGWEFAFSAHHGAFALHLTTGPAGRLPIRVRRGILRPDAMVAIFA